MVIASRTPEGQPNHCPVCDSDLRIEPSYPAGDAPCPRCGHLLWFTWEDLGDVQVFKPMGDVLRAKSLDGLLDSLAIPAGRRFVLDLCEIQSFSSAAFVKLIMLKRKLVGVKGRLVIRHVHPDLMELFRITRLDQVFELET
jgi:anti-anti-sigma factor